MGPDVDNQQHGVTPFVVELVAVISGAGVVLLLLHWLAAAIPLLNGLHLF